VLRRIKGKCFDESGFQSVSFLYLGDGLPLLSVCVELVFLEEGLAGAGYEVLRMIMELGYAHRFYCFKSDIFGREL